MILTLLRCSLARHGLDRGGNRLGNAAGQLGIVKRQLRVAAGEDGVDSAELAKETLCVGNREENHRYCAGTVHRSEPNDADHPGICGAVLRNDPNPIVDLDRKRVRGAPIDDDITRSIRCPPANQGVRVHLRIGDPVLRDRSTGGFTGNARRRSTSLVDHIGVAGNALRNGIHAGHLRYGLGKFTIYSPAKHFALALCRRLLLHDDGHVLVGVAEQ